MIDALVSTLALAETAWVAGFYDGEGCCSTTTSGDRRYLQLAIGNTDRALLERAQAVIGGRIYEQRAKNAWGRKPIWTLKMGGMDAVSAAIGRLWPFLGVAKREQYERARALVEANRPREPHRGWPKGVPRGPSARKPCRYCRRLIGVSTLWRHESACFRSKIVDCGSPEEEYARAAALGDRRSKLADAP